MVSKRKITTGMGATLFLAWVIATQGWNALLPVATVSAADVAFQDTFFSAIGVLFGFLITFFQFLLYIFLSFAAVFLDPKFMDMSTHAGSMGAVLLSLWQIMRNLTNILFVFMLLAGAAMTVVMGSDFIKKFAPKFIIAVILVNFSWFFPRVVLDVANVLTATIYALPSEISVAPCKTFDLTGKNQADCEVIVAYSFFQKPPAGDASWTCPIINDPPIVCIKTAPMDAQANHPNAILSGLVYNHARLKYLAKVVKPDGAAGIPLAGPGAMGRLQQLITLTLLEALVMVFSAAVLFPIMALVIVLFARMLIIWATVAFMPLMFLGFVAGEYFGGFNPMGIWKKFLASAFLPTIVAIPFSIGYIMLNIAMSATPPAAAGPLRDTAGLPLIGGVKDLWQLLWVVMAIMVVWIGSFKALSIDKTFERIAAPFKSAGESLGRFMVKLPLIWPLPLPGGGAGISPLGAMKAIANPEAMISSTGQFRGLEAFRGAPAGAAPLNTANAVTKIADQITHNNNTIQMAANALNNAPTDAEKQVKTQALKGAVREVLRPLGFTWEGDNEELKRLLRELRDKVPANAIPANVENNIR